MIVYKATNKEIDSVYIGVTTRSLHKRRLEHIYASKNGSETKFHRAIQTYGVESFEWEISAEVENVDELMLLEKQHIQQCKLKQAILNMTSGGQGMCGYKMSYETRLKISLSKFGKKDSESTRAKKSFYSSNRTLEHRLALAKSLIGKTVPNAIRNKIKISLIGRKLTSKHKENIKKSLQSDEVRVQMGFVNRRENLSEERLRKLSVASSKSVMQFDLKGNTIATYPSVKDASLALGVSGSAITHVLKGRRPHIRGYFWKYAADSHSTNDVS